VESRRLWWTNCEKLEKEMRLLYFSFLFSVGCARQEMDYFAGGADDDEDDDSGTPEILSWIEEKVKEVGTSLFGEEEDDDKKEISQLSDPKESFREQFERQQDDRYRPYDREERLPYENQYIDRNREDYHTDRTPRYDTDDRRRVPYDVVHRTHREEPPLYHESRYERERDDRDDPEFESRSYRSTHERPVTRRSPFQRENAERENILTVQEDLPKPSKVEPRERNQLWQFEDSDHQEKNRPQEIFTGSLHKVERPILPPKELISGDFINEREPESLQHPDQENLSDKFKENEFKEEPDQNELQSVLPDRFIANEFKDEDRPDELFNHGKESLFSGQDSFQDEDYLDESPSIEAPEKVPKNQNLADVKLSEAAPDPHGRMHRIEGVAKALFLEEEQVLVDHGIIPTTEVNQNETSQSQPILSQVQSHTADRVMDTDATDSEATAIKHKLESLRDDLEKLEEAHKPSEKVDVSESKNDSMNFDDDIVIAKHAVPSQELFTASDDEDRMAAERTAPSQIGTKRFASSQESLQISDDEDDNIATEQASPSHSYNNIGTSKEATPRDASSSQKSFDLDDTEKKSLNGSDDDDVIFSKRSLSPESENIALDKEKLSERESLSFSSDTLESTSTKSLLDEAAQTLSEITNTLDTQEKKTPIDKYKLPARKRRQSSELPRERNFERRDLSYPSTRASIAHGRDVSRRRQHRTFEEDQEPKNWGQIFREYQQLAEHLIEQDLDDTEHHAKMSMLSLDDEVVSPQDTQDPDIAFEIKISKDFKEMLDKLGNMPDSPQRRELIDKANELYQRYKEDEKYLNYDQDTFAEVDDDPEHYIRFLSQEPIQDHCVDKISGCNDNIDCNVKLGAGETAFTLCPSICKNSCRSDRGLSYF